MRATCGPSVLDTACFPLVPFSNRIANGRFVVDGMDVRLTPNLPGSAHPHCLHGFGWLAGWRVVEAADDKATLVHDYPGGEWPWPYHARQTFRLTADGLSMTLSVANHGASAMPAGLGFHPYFPGADDALYRGLHRGEWQITADCLPLSLNQAPEPVDWWHGAPVTSRNVDTAYTGRAGLLELSWPSRRFGLTITPSDNLPVTVVYTPSGVDHFCVEPVSHITDAINRKGTGGGMLWLEPGESMEAAMQVSGYLLNTDYQ